jgi:hypothetical protein
MGEVWQAGRLRSWMAARITGARVVRGVRAVGFRSRMIAGLCGGIAGIARAMRELGFPMTKQNRGMEFCELERLVPMSEYFIGLIRWLFRSFRC